MGDYRVIIADPPWGYTNQGRPCPYPTMTGDEICVLPVATLAADDAVLLLWATWPQLPECLRVVAAWDFEYVTGFPWIKIQGEPRRNLWGETEYRPQYGMGFWARGCSEAVFVCRRGNVAAPLSDFVGLISRNFYHSRKPENLYEYAEQFGGPYLELFARRERAGWARWGNEVASTVTLAAD